jgi:Acetylornithine deacetylase/Succinyl-diaminopimelate desuccinylase and related deacylases
MESMTSRAVPLLQDLIRIPSVNPDGDGEDPSHVGERRMAEFLADHLRDLGAGVRLDEVRDGRPNVVARFASPGKPRLLLAPHTDTVGVAGMAIDPFSGEIRDGRILGRGASDTKGSIAAMLEALRRCRDVLPELSHEVWFAGLMGEEAGLHGSQDLAQREKFDFVIVGEPTGLDVVHLTKGSMWLTLRIAGEAAHASTPERGVNALYKAADLLRCIRDDIAPSLAQLSHPVLGSPTISAGTCRGGSKTNVVPDACEITVDARTLPGQDISPLLETLRATCPDVEISIWEAKPMHTDPGHPLVSALERCGSRCVGAPWFCDAAIFAQAGMPAVAVGPGSIAQAHTKDEFISIADLEAGADFFERFLRNLTPQA